MSVKSVNKIYCTHGVKRHQHKDLNELAACVSHFKAHAHPRDEAKMVALGLPAAYAHEVKRADVSVVLTYLIERAQPDRVNNRSVHALPF